MIGFDTNILVRYLVEDDPIQSPIARDLIERLSEKEPGFVSVVAMAEAAWVLGSTYRFTDSQTAAALERILQTEVLVVERESEVYEATEIMREGRGSFADALIAVVDRLVGCQHTLTFDRKAARLPEFELVPTPSTRRGRTR